MEFDNEVQSIGPMEAQHTVPIDEVIDDYKEEGQVIVQIKTRTLHPASPKCKRRRPRL